MAERRRNPRREALAMLREVKEWATAMVRVWDDVPSLRWYDSGDGFGRRWQISQRRRADVSPDEYRENRLDEWERLDKYAYAIIVRAEEIREYAQKRAAEVRAGKRW